MSLHDSRDDLRNLIDVGRRMSSSRKHPTLKKGTKTLGAPSKTTSKPVPIYYAACFSGGGIRTVVYSGVIRALYEFGVLDTLKSVVGSSAGTIASACVALKYTHKEVKDLMMTLNRDVLSDWLPFGKAQMAWRYSRHLYINSGKQLNQFLQSIVAKKTGTDGKKETLDALRKDGRFLSDIRLVGTNKNWQRGEYLNETHADKPYWKLMRASCAIPVWYPAVRLGDDDYVDGGLMNNDALDTFDIKDQHGRIIRGNEHVLNFLLFHEGELKNTQLTDRRPTPTTMSGDLTRIIDCTTTQNLRLHIEARPHFWKQTICIPVSHVGMLQKLSRKEKENLDMVGYKYTVEGLVKRGLTRVRYADGTPAVSPSTLEKKT